MKDRNLLPLGTVVVLEGGVKKVMIIARGVAVKKDEELQYFEYGGCLYPEGLLGEQLLNFNNENIVKVVAQGFQDEDDELMQNNLNQWIDRTQMKKATALDWIKKK